MELTPQILYNVSDATWEPHADAVCHIILSENHITKIIFDKIRQRFVSLYGVQTDAATLKSITDASAMPLDVQIPIKYFLSVPKTMIVPEVLYEPGMQKTLFEHHQKIENNDVISSWPVKHMDAELIFAYPDFFDRFKKDLNLPNTRFIPSDALWLEAINLSNEIQGPHIHFNLSDNFISVAVYKGSQLHLYNTYPAINAEEVLYYLIFVSEQLQVNPQRDAYLYSGFIRKGDAYLNILSKYIRDLKPEERPSRFNYSLPVIDVPGHIFFQSFCTALCES